MFWPAGAGQQGFTRGKPVLLPGQTGRMSRLFNHFRFYENPALHGAFRSAAALLIDGVFTEVSYFERNL
jgi:hypothetical protein